MESAIAAVPTHCKPDEFAITNAWMGTTKSTDSGWKNTKNGKLLSVCADRKKEPFEKIAYRYGAPGQAEFEALASESRKFFVYNRQTSPHTADDIIFFTNANYTYYVAIAAGQGSGVKLRVYDGKKLILNRFSGNDEDDDFSLGPAAIDFSKIKSKALQLKEPEHAF